ncbi:hypothetical protein Ae406Ps2_0633c [Pseudonocardia sp. Ae406_Ps2]|nr:hypothetical protein Ae406Ps2_0633c [Pseudonocardia sp. Ae406_Ps2]OLM07577.1 hypothetical protein Ae331Ps2_5287 [Pseudonocardia sp. Ae331_Ps2]OLM14764.1 hypothetical protein Ae505Ps2_4895 [Pseudonocardia sp. Ae505_Ps2]OLM22205.1 hypothetical protein Ae706Ps2_0637c [Pseudonocardia sp. Ae706_Ps2]
MTERESTVSTPDLARFMERRAEMTKTNLITCA